MEQSKEAKEKWVCHTESECWQMFKDIPADKVNEAVDILQKTIPDQDQKLIRKLIHQYGFGDWMFHLYDDLIEEEKKKPGWEPWMALTMNPHLGFGMSVRNLLRTKKCGENELKIHNLDDVYVFLLEAAFA